MKNTEHYFKDAELTDFMMDMESVPMISKIELTSDCQLSCPGCPTGKLIPTGKNDMPLSTLERIVDIDALRSTNYVELMMSGEATLHKHFSEAIDIVKRSGIMVGISTNLVDRRKIPALAKLDSITVSMDVFNKEGYEISRPPMKFDRLLENIRELVSVCDSSTLIYLQLLRTQFTEKWFLESIPLARKFIESLDAENVALRYVSDCFGEVMGRETKEDYSKMCTTPWNAVVIKNNGNVMPCGYCFNGTEEGMVLGNICVNSLEDIWKGGPVEKLRRAHQTQTNLPPRCLACKNGSRSNHVFQTTIANDILRMRNGIKIV